MNYTDRLCPVCGAKLLLVSYSIDTHRNGFSCDVERVAKELREALKP